MMGTGHLTRFPVAATLSEEARRYFEMTFSYERREQMEVPAIDDVRAWEARNRREVQAVAPLNEILRVRYPARVIEHDCDGVRVIEFRPSNHIQSPHALIYVHGGGYVGGTAADSLDSTLPMASASGLSVFSIDYTTAPRARFPIAVDEVAAAIDHLCRNYGAGNLALYAESAGAGLAMGGLLKLRDEKVALPNSVVLWSPWAEMRELGDTYITLAEQDPQFTYARFLNAAAHAYADPQQHAHPWISAANADYTNFFPPTLIQVGTRELFLSNAVRLYRAMTDAGREVTLDLYEGMWHAFHFQPVDMPEARLARANSLAFIERQWVSEVCRPPC